MIKNKAVLKLKKLKIISSKLHNKLILSIKKELILILKKLPLGNMFLMIVLYPFSISGILKYGKNLDLLSETLFYYKNSIS